MMKLHMTVIHNIETIYYGLYENYSENFHELLRNQIPHMWWIK